MRLRITFAKTGALRYTGHLDLHKIWERTVRRAGLPLAYTRGFHPGPKIQLACALPLGFSSRAELVDLWLDEAEGSVIRPTVEILQAAAPPGLTILEVTEVDARAPALQNLVISAEYEVTLLDPVDIADLSHKLSALMEAESLPRQRRGKSYDLRPLIEALALTPVPSLTPTPLPKGEGQEVREVRVFMRVAAREGATGRPEEILDALGLPLEAAHIERIRLIFKTEIPSAV
jgi:radical SAM-linked protein